MLSICYQIGRNSLKFSTFPGLDPGKTEKREISITPTRCRDLRLKQFCLEDIAPAILIILIAHIIIAVRWMLIKILSAVINSIRRESNTSLGLSCRRSIVLGQQIHTILVHADALPLGVFGQELVQAFENSQLDLAGIAFQIVWLPDGDTVL